MKDKTRKVLFLIMGAWLIGSILLFSSSDLGESKLICCAGNKEATPEKCMSALSGHYNVIKKNVINKPGMTPPPICYENGTAVISKLEGVEENATLFKRENGWLVAKNNKTIEISNE